MTRPGHSLQSVFCWLNNRQMKALQFRNKSSLIQTILESPGSSNTFLYSGVELEFSTFRSEDYQRQIINDYDSLADLTSQLTSDEEEDDQEDASSPHRPMRPLCFRNNGLLVSHFLSKNRKQSSRRRLDFRNSSSILSELLHPKGKEISSPDR